MSKIEDQMINWGGNGPILHIAHANSYHPAVYRNLIEDLKTDFEVHTILLRPFHDEYDVKDFRTWNQFRDDFLEIADKKNWKNLIGVGHSLGSTITMMAEIKSPGLFQKMVIIEPPCIDQIFYTLLDILPYSISKGFVPPSKIALKRRHKWPSKEVAFDLFRLKSIYKQVDDETLKAFVESALVKDEKGEFRLAFSKFWESKVYCTIQNPYKLFPKLKIPCLCIRGAITDVISQKNWQKWKNIHKDATFVNLENGTHLVPLEQPQKIAMEIKKFVLG